LGRWFFKTTIEEKAGLPSLRNKKLSMMFNVKPIRLDTGLLVYLDRLKRQYFLEEWNRALVR
jgi:iron(III) transport system substrate-binding protein